MPVILQHSPSICWNSSEILLWREHCFMSCLKPVKKISVKQPFFKKTPTLVPITVNSTSIESPETFNPQEVPLEYLAFQDVFSKQLATKISTHRPWDCGIDLLPVATLPKGKVYPLSVPEQKAMEEYIEEALEQEFIHPSINFPCYFKFLLCWEKGRRLASLH